MKLLRVPVCNWQPIVERVHKKLSSWKANSLSSWGRLTLSRVVLGSLPLYYFSFLRAPKSGPDNLEPIRRKFFWGGCEEKHKINWVAWDIFLGPKEKGGLGIGSFMSLNTTLLVKWLWRFKKDLSSLWMRAVNGIHNIKKHVGAWAKRSLAGVWSRQYHSSYQWFGGLLLLYLWHLHRGW